MIPAMQESRRINRRTMDYPVSQDNVCHHALALVKTIPHLEEVVVRLRLTF